MSQNRALWSIVVIGLGAIGRVLVELLAREPRVGSLTLVDPQSYEAANIVSQAITSADLGQLKVGSAAIRIRAIRPDLKIDTFAATAEQLPLGIYRAADAVIACVDSKRARQQIATRAWRAGAPLIDCGVNSDEALSRVSTFIPGESAPCLECAWGDEDYAAIGQQFRCDGAINEAAPTRSPAWLGAHPACIAAAELSSLLEGGHDPKRTGSDIITNLRGRTHYVTGRQQNPRCLFDHVTLQITPLLRDPGRISFEALLREANAAALRVEPSSFILDAACISCGAREPAFALADRFAQACVHCGSALRPLGSGLRDWISAADLTRAQLASPLALAGIQLRDVLRLRRADGSETASELTSAA